MTSRLRRLKRWHCFFLGVFPVLVRSLWFDLRFRRSVSLGGAFVLSGVPAVAFDRVLARLFVLGCSFVSAGCGLRSGGCWVCPLFFYAIAYFFSWM